MLRSIYSFFVLTWVTVFYTVWVAVLAVVTGRRSRAYMMIRAWARSLLWIFRVRLRVVGAEKLDFHMPLIYMSNHVSQADIPILMSAIPAGLSFISKDTLGKIPFLGWSMKMVGMIFINRKDSRGSVAALKQAASEIDADMNFLVFPEGTRNPRGGRVLQPIKKGGFHLAQACRRPIQPVAVIGSDQILKIGGMSILPGEVEVRFGRPIYVDADRPLDDLIASYRQEMDTLLAAPLGVESATQPAFAREYGRD